MHTVRHGSGKRLLVSIGDDITAPEEFTVYAVTDIDWNKSLSPWPCEKAFAKGEPFAGEADAFLEELLPKLNELIAEGWQDVTIIGYSLAGLFALYACTKTDIFDACASVSGSIWYPGFLEYLQEHKVQCTKVILSLGDKEAQTKNPLMRTVAERTEAVRTLLAGYTDVQFHWNPGNHFNEAEKRIDRAIHCL